MSSYIHSKTKNNVFSSFQNRAHTKNVYSTLYYKRNHRTEEADTRTKVKIAAGSVVSTLLPIIYFAKKQNGLKKITDIFKVKYDIKEVLALSTSSIAGGAISGIIVDKKTKRKHKINEAVFQFLNATIPTLLVGGAMNLIKDNVKYKNSKPAKIAAVATGIISGMPLAAWLANIINDPKDKEPDRKLTLKDSVINMDDALGALVIAKIPVVSKLHLEKVMPAIFAWCGYRAGQSN